ncbi:MAG: hypothetical protein CMJ77_12670 [Planctomycetaceae bacterium]|nr:hypothetical protein [Planctomycetaceae bacterium]
MRLPIYPRELAFATEISGSGAQRSENSLTFQIFFRLLALRKPGVIQILHKRIKCLAFGDMPRITKKNPRLSPYACPKRFLVNHYKVGRRSVCSVERHLKGFGQPQRVLALDDSQALFHVAKNRVFLSLNQIAFSISSKP